MDAQFIHERLPMNTHGFDADAKVCRNEFVGLARRNEVHDFDLPLGQWRLDLLPWIELRDLHLLGLFWLLFFEHLKAALPQEARHVSIHVLVGNQDGDVGHSRGCGLWLFTA